MQPPRHRIAIRTVDGRAEFYDTISGEPFVVRGANYVWVPTGSGSLSNQPFRPGVFDPDRIRSDFSTLHDHGFNTVRMFLDACSTGPGCITAADKAGLNEDYIANVSQTIAIASETGLYLLLTANDIPDGGGYGDLANSQAGPDFAGYRNAHFLTGAGHRAMQQYWTDILEGLLAQGSSFESVLGWQILNEEWLFKDQPPLSLTSGEVVPVNGIQYDMSDPLDKAAMVRANVTLMIEGVTDSIKIIDPQALVTMGFFAPQFPNETGIGGSWYVDTAGLIHMRAPLDFYDFHAYPGEDIPLQQIAENFGMLGFDEKPVIMGEFGPFHHRYPEADAALRSTTSWIADSCQYGFDGWLYWSYYAAPPSVGDSTWGLIDDQNAFMELLAPAANPDPCRPVQVAHSNLAYGAEVNSSRWLNEEQPQLAVDGSTETQWGSGAEAPQWIEIDLGQPVAVTAIELVVAQWPEGMTVHRLLAGPSPEELTPLTTFEGETNEGDLLRYESESGLPGIRIIRVQTLVSPSWVSWKEIRVYGQ